MMRKGYIFKVVVVGNGAVGKTSLVLRYTQHKFSENRLFFLPNLLSRYEC